VHFAFSLLNSRGSYALISDREDSDKAAIFVHGFMGGPASTWVDFQGLVDSGLSGIPSWWQTTDMYFYTYKSVDGALEFNTSDLKRFVSQIFPAVSAHVFHKIRKDSFKKSAPYAFPDNTRSYRKLIFVGHSEGAVIIRKVIINVVRELEESDEVQHIEDTGVLASTLNLFSPAILGFKPSGGLSLLLGLDIPNARSALRAHNELQPDSPLLTDLKEATFLLADRYKNIPALRARIGFGRDERIVHIGKYLMDPDIRELTGTHTSVCKPFSTFLEPFEFVVDATRITKSTSASES
jgi:hypothetical protein